jgi:cytochrome c biogenesis protein CcmG/thiol:disulfide interchange protein DsbE
MAAMNMRRGAAATVVALGLVAASCGKGGDAAAPTTPVVLTSPRAVNAATAPLLPTGRFALPAFDYAKYQALLAQLRGTPVVVNLWGSWCGPCRKEAPLLAQAGRRFAKRVQFLGVDVGDVSRAQAQVFIRDFGWPYPSIYDPPEQILSGLGFVGPPITMVFDGSGKRVATFSGPLRSLSTLARALENVA